MTSETNHPGSTPPWAQKADDFGKRHWRKDKPLKNRRGEHIWAIIWNIIFLWVVNKVPDWNLSFINDHYNAVLIFLNLNIYVQIAAHTVMAFLEIKWIYFLLRIVSEAATFVLFVILYYMYPFDFSGTTYGWLDTVLPILMIITMVVSGISVIVYLLRLVFYRP